ncbi:hypothetical protein SISNIDRAFT_453745, partial [Sistotremastrum niveocremeum HHB9708]
MPLPTLKSQSSNLFSNPVPPNSWARRMRIFATQLHLPVATKHRKISKPQPQATRYTSTKAPSASSSWVAGHDSQPSLRSQQSHTHARHPLRMATSSSTVHTVLHDRDERVISRSISSAYGFVNAPSLPFPPSLASSASGFHLGLINHGLGNLALSHVAQKQKQKLERELDESVGMGPVPSISIIVPAENEHKQGISHTKSQATLALWDEICDTPLLASTLTSLHTGLGKNAVHTNDLERERRRNADYTHPPSSTVSSTALQKGHRPAVYQLSPKPRTILGETRKGTPRTHRSSHFKRPPSAVDENTSRRDNLPLCPGGRRDTITPSRLSASGPTIQSPCSGVAVGW